MAKRGSLKSPMSGTPGGEYVELVHRYGLDDPEPEGSQLPATQELAMERLRAGGMSSSQLSCTTVGGPSIRERCHGRGYRG